MIARCARCQGTFTTDRFGQQTCPHCGSELLLSDPNAPAAGQGQPPPGPPAGGPPPQPPPPAPPHVPPAPPQVPPASAGGFPPAGPPPGGWPAPPGGGFPPYPPGGAGPGIETPSPFAERSQRGFFAAFFETWKLVATQPQQFFARVRIDQTGSALLFAVIATTAGSLVAGVYNWLSGQQALLGLREAMNNVPEEQARFFQMYAELLSGPMILGQVVLAPILTLIWVYVGSAILHLILMLFRGAKRPFDATLTVVAYACGLNLLLAVPICGGLLAGVWGLVVVIIGLGEAQRCGSGKAAAAVLAPAVLFCVCCCAAFGLTVPSFLKEFQDAAKQGTQTTNL